VELERAGSFRTFPDEHKAGVGARELTLDQLRVSLDACEEILARARAKQPSLPAETLQAIERVCAEFRAELERRAA
jgi:hypothetical protein